MCKITEFRPYFHPWTITVKKLLMKANTVIYIVKINISNQGWWGNITHKSIINIKTHFFMTFSSSFQVL